MDNQTIQLAILGLEEQRRKIDDAIRELRAQSTGASSPSSSAPKTGGSAKRRLTQAQRDAISKRMAATWAARRKAKAAKGGSAK